MSGLECALEHTIVELPIVVGSSIGSLSSLQNNPLALRIIGLMGGIVILLFAALQAWQAKDEVGFEPKLECARGTRRSNPGVLPGVVFTALNPFFILWWLSIGWSLIVEAVVLGALAGVLVMYLAHVWMDYAWLGGVGFVAEQAQGPFWELVSCAVVRLRSRNGLLRCPVHSF